MTFTARLDPNSDLHQTTLHLAGRLDAHGTTLLQPVLETALGQAPALLVLDFADVDYLSSAGVRALVSAWKKQRSVGHRMRLDHLTPYVAEVLDLAGLEDLLAGAVPPPDVALPWHRAEVWEAPGLATLRLLPSGEGPAFIRIAGDINDVLAARISEAHIRSKTFSDTAYSIGLGALGATVEECLPLMGEMITMAGTMVWLPTDGQDTPDYLIPRHDRGQITLRTGFNASLPGPFHDIAEVRAADPVGGLTISGLYRALFDFAKARRPAFRGALGLAVVADMPTLLGAGVVKAPIARFAPANGKLITDPSNFPHWFEADRTPRHMNVLGLLTGAGLDLTADLSGFHQPSLQATFYVNPADAGTKTEMLHNHAVVFAPQPLPELPGDINAEVRRIIETGTFRDMRHLLDSSTIRRAIVGVQYIRDFEPDTAWR
ncbi:MAG: STAS domain-containing protein [Verrucomicrobiia bacterium]